MASAKQLAVPPNQLGGEPVAVGGGAQCGAPPILIGRPA